MLLYRGTGTGTGTVWFDDIYVKDEEQNENPQAELKVVEQYSYDKNGNRKSATLNGTTINASYTSRPYDIRYNICTYPKLISKPSRFP